MPTFIKPRDKQAEGAIFFHCGWLIILFFLSGCQQALIDNYGYGKIPTAEQDIYQQGFIVQIPKNAPSISQRFRPHPESGSNDTMFSIHDGIDIIAAGDTPILAAAAGKVIHSHLTILRGNRVVLEHGLNSQGELIRTEYNHLSRRLVKEGALVARGEPIGTLGMTGLTGGFPHLHYMVTITKKSGSEEKVIPVNPHLYWAEGIGKITCFNKGKTDFIPSDKMTYPVTCR